MKVKQNTSTFRDVERIEEKLKPFLKKETLKAIEKRHFKTLKGKTFEVLFIGFRSLSDKTGIKGLGNRLNEICETYEVVGNFAFAIKLALSKKIGGGALYLSYLAFTPKSAKKIIKTLKEKSNVQQYR